MSSIFGGSKQQSTQSSSNQAFQPVSTAFSPLLGNAAQGASGIQALLSGDPTGFNAYKGATGYDAASEAGSRGITGNAAAGGLLRSGSTAKALQAFGTSMQNQYANSYLDRLFQQAGLGFNAANAMTGAGGISQGLSSGSSKPGIGGFLGSVASGIAASDRRLKKKIAKVGKLKNGLNLYQYFYINDAGPYVGVMADEVEQIAPEALGPVIGGYQTVNYDLLEGVGE